MPRKPGTERRAHRYDLASGGSCELFVDHLHERRDERVTVARRVCGEVAYERAENCALSPAQHREGFETPCGILIGLSRGCRGAEAHGDERRAVDDRFDVCPIDHVLILALLRVHRDSPGRADGIGGAGAVTGVGRGETFGWVRSHSCFVICTRHCVALCPCRAELLLKASLAASQRFRIVRGGAMSRVRTLELIDEVAGRPTFVPQTRDFFAGARTGEERLGCGQVRPSLCPRNAVQALRR